MTTPETLRSCIKSYFSGENPPHYITRQEVLEKLDQIIEKAELLDELEKLAAIKSVCIERPLRSSGAKDGWDVWLKGIRCVFNRLTFTEALKAALKWPK